MVQRIREAAAKRLGNPPPDPSSSTESSGRRSSTPREKTAGWGPKPRTAGGAKAGTQRQQQVRLIQAGCGPISKSKLLNYPFWTRSNLKRSMLVFILIKHVIPGIEWYSRVCAFMAPSRLQEWLDQVQAMVNKLLASKQLLGTMDLNIQQMKQQVVKAHCTKGSPYVGRLSRTWRLNQFSLLLICCMHIFHQLVLMCHSCKPFL